ncbi:dolichyl-phosphate-mannose--protein mannosyltransferase [Dictyobacter alpinus]|uniref:Dolichyl-phosphate-mannose--protein mannosyltransferase n=1 Tax=Dictyobacter alpinus TaxID=2014873 RepID=A0A402BBC0_9CHLR|nr:glycosyltransferase family 39 protein [Dictyobacter alpinus]GCE28580.1 dolichyl-phosphate-mannose--protein mannosyltransferase [Dictyobacter alpinus]
MIDTTSSVPVVPSEPLERPARRWTRLWQPVSLGIILLTSIFMNFYQLGQNGFGNTYYASAIRSMLDSWHTFFFVSLDPVGFVSVDKPPLGFWLQAASAKVFGFTPFSVFFPQALAGVLAVLLLYHLVRRHFGVVAGLLAALALAVSPISVVTNRNNTIDSTLVLTMLLGAWTIMKAAETGKWRWLLLTAVLVGLGFNIKMLEAYLVVPAYALLYLLAAPRSLKMRIAQLLVAAAVMLAISLSWAVVVDLTPASQRPYVGSSQDNSELSLALGYNGVQRLLGSFGIGGSRNAGTQASPTTGNPPQGTPPPQGINGAQPPQGAPGGTGGMFNTGTPGILRLFNEPLGGQIVWLLPLALFGIVALAWQGRPRFRASPEQQSLILWGIWLLTMGAFFSIASFFHQYYLSTLAPAICALFGIGVVVMWRDYWHTNWRGWLLPIALMLTAFEQIHIIMSNSAWGTWLIPVIATGCTLASLILFGARLFPRLNLNKPMLVSALCTGLLVLLLTSAIWSAVPAIQNTADNLPVAGPSQQMVLGRENVTARQSGVVPQRPAAGPGGGGNVSSALIKYLEANQGNAKYLVAVPSSNQADAIILATNKGVMALGGFSGSDPILTTSQLSALVANGTIRYFLLNDPGAFAGGHRGGQSTLTTWVTQNCATVNASQWQGKASSTTTQLYNCTPTK